MTDITGALSKIQVEEVGYGRAVSESTFSKIGAVVNYLIENAVDYIGKVEATALTEDQFATIKNYNPSDSEASKKWVMFKGQSISGSDFSTLTGITTLPDAYTNGAFLGQLRAAETMLEYQADSNLAHEHTIYTGSTSREGADVGGPFKTLIENTGATNTADRTGISIFSVDPATVGNVNNGMEMYGESSGGTESKPRNIRLNFFIKINA